MTQSVKIQLAKALRALSGDRIHSFGVVVKDRNPNYDGSNIFKWEIRVIPRYGFIGNVGQLVDLARKVNPTILITFSQDEKSYLTFY